VFPAVLPVVTLSANASTRTVIPRVSLCDPAGATLATYDDASLMADFYPLRVHLADKRYVIIPIFKRWVDAMLSTSGPGTPLKLRVDNAYYCYPKLPTLSRGDLVVFYEPKKEGGRGVAIGSAVTLEALVGQPKLLHDRFANLGVYRFADVVSHASVQGNAMAIRFGIFEPFARLVTLRRIRVILGHGTNVQGLTPIKRDAFERIRADGLGQP
jgi:hypothetical protein